MCSSELLDPTHIYWNPPSIIHDDTIQPFKVTRTEADEIALTTCNTVPPSVLQLFDESSCQTLADAKRKLANLITCTRKWQKKPPLDGRAMAKKVAIEILKAEQETTIPEVLEYLQTKQGPRPACIQPLCLFLDSTGLVRCGGRLGNTSLSYSSRFPIYYPNNSPLLKLRVLEVHHLAKHAGPGVTRAKIQQQLWIPRSSISIKRILKDCFKCKKQSGKAFRWPKSPNLPQARVTIEPYNTIGCDLTGFFHVRNGENIEKVYIAVFTDCGTRHISIEIMDNMETGTFLQAFRRHCSMYGTPTKIISDQATYFIKSAAILGDKIGEEWCNTIGEAMNKKGITWQFNPAASPHIGGHYERLIAVLKGPLKRCIGRAILNKPEFITLCKEATCVVNDRPLCATNPTNRDRIPITPNSLVFGRTLSPLPYGEGNLEDLDDPLYCENEDIIDKTWKRMASRITFFKQQFQEEYLLYLRTRHQQDHHDDPVITPKINVGDLVLIKHDDVKRCLWDFGEITEIYPSSDDRTRAVKLRTRNGEISRPIVKLFPMLSAEQLRPNTEHEEQNQVDHGNQNQVDHRDQNQVEQEEIQPGQQEEAPLSRPQRRAKAAGRKNVQQWANQLLKD